MAAHICLDLHQYVYLYSSHLLQQTTEINMLSHKITPHLIIKNLNKNMITTFG